MASNPRYDPLPLTHDQGDQSVRLGNLDSPNLSTYDTPPLGTPSMPGGDLPTGAGQPRFLGQALYDDPRTGARDSIASQNTLPSHEGSTFNDSVYALNPGTGMRESSYTGYKDDPRDEYYAGQPGSLAMSPVGTPARLEEKRAAYAGPRQKSRRKLFVWGGIIALILLALAVVIPVYFAVIKPSKKDDSSSESEGANGGHDKPGEHNKPDPSKPQVALSGGDGSEITMEDGTKFTYSNKFGGTWYWDPEDPFNNNAQAQSWTTPLNGSFKYGTENIRGVNLGGWLNTEPFMIPSLYEQYMKAATPAVDEWTLSVNMRADSARGGIQQMEDHYKTFITEKDFAEIAGAGLNYVRIPIGWWAIEVRDDEPFLPKVSWNYFLKAIQWARKYGIRINLDLHAVPGSQNAWNHSGRQGTVNFLYGPMGYANAQRTLDYIRIIAEFISQPQYSSVVTMFGIINEPHAPTFGDSILLDFYAQAYKIVREASGTGEGKGPWISIHDGFRSRSDFAGFMENADRITLDTHPYLCFSTQSDAPMSSYAKTPCTAWAKNVNDSMNAFGLTNAGEFSNAVTDCGWLLNGVGDGVRYEGNYKVGSAPRIGSCDEWNDWTKFTDSRKRDIKNFALASMDALQNYFFWNWKIGNSTITNRVNAPDWSYQLGLQNGWMPTDPREAEGVCGGNNPWQPPLPAWHTGGAGAGQGVKTNGRVWPPTAISKADVGSIPTYTAGGEIITLPGPTFTAASSKTTIDVGNGWANSNDNAKLAVMPAGCPYIDPWIGPDSSVTPCTGGAAEAAVPSAEDPSITPPP